MPQTANIAIQDKTRWFSKPNSDHIVHFYPLENELITSLGEYVSTGLKEGETCIVIAKPATFIKLNQKLRHSGIDIDDAIDTGQYIIYDAEELLAKFMKQGQPNLEEFMATVGKVISFAVGRERPIRAFGEMVAILLSQQNHLGTINLEKYWNDLMKTHDFSLYCAYPETAFEASDKHKNTFKDICSCHADTVLTPA